MKAEREDDGTPGGIGIDFHEVELGAFLDREFDGVPGLVAEYPLLAGACNAGRRFVLRDADGALCAHAAWRALRLRCGAQRVNAAGIGLVTTAKRARGRGLATRLVSYCAEHARAAGMDVALLFAPPRSLYTELGFRPAGRERVIRPSVSGCVPDARVRLAAPRDTVRLHALLEEHVVRVERSVEEFGILASLPDTRVHVLEEGEAGVTAYCVEGKGRDLQGVIHEWAGDPEAVRLLLGDRIAALSRGGEPPWLLSPLALPAPLAGESAAGCVALMRVLAPGRFGGETDPRALFGDADTPARIPLYVWGLDSV